MYRRYLSLLILCVPLVTSVLGQSFTERLDSILNAPRDTQQLEQLSELLTDLINTGELVPDTLFDRSLALARELEDPWTLAVVYSNRSVYDLNTGEAEKGLVSIEEAIKYAEESEKDYLLAAAYATKVQLLLVAGYTKEAAALASSLAKQYHDTGDLYSEAETYQMLSKISSSLGENEMTLKYDSLAIALANQSEYVDIIVSVLCSASDNFSLLGNPERGLALAEEALEIIAEYEIEFETANALSARASAHTALGNYAEAIADFESLEEWEGEQQYTWWMVSKGILLQRVGRHDEARAILLEATKLLKETSNNPLELKRGYRALQTVGLNQAQYDTVAWYGKLMEAAQDSLQAAENIKNLLELEEKYKTEEKIGEILLQKERLAGQQQQLYVTISMLLLALVAGAFLLLLSRRLRRRNLENEQLLRDKETLISEIHHRVKNNLQVVSSLLQLQRRGLATDDERGREALLESQSRVSAMGLIHNKLYQGTEVTSVYMPDYLEDLGETLLDAYRLEEKVEIFYDVGDLRLDVKNAIPLGLIINELVTNSLKYAFPKDREGTIEIALHRQGNQLRLAVTDDGVGAAKAKRRKDSTSYGSNLVGLLTKKLKGSLNVLEGSGYGTEIMFKE